MRTSSIGIIVIAALFAQSLIAQTSKQAEKNFKIIPPNVSQSFMFTNRAGMFYYGNTGLPNTSRFQGLSVLTSKKLEDYILEINGQILDRSQAEAHLFSDKLERHYGGLSIIEEISVSDSLPVLIVKINSQQKLPISVLPIFFTSTISRDYAKLWSPTDNMLFISQNQQLVQNNRTEHAGWLGISTFPIGNFIEDGFEQNKYQNFISNKDIFLPGKIDFFLTEGPNLILFIIADSKKEAIAFRNEILKKFNKRLDKKEVPIEGIRKV